MKLRWRRRFAAAISRAAHACAPCHRRHWRRTPSPFLQLPRRPRISQASSRITNNTTHMRFFLIVGTLTYAVSLQIGKLLGAGLVRLLQWWANHRKNQSRK